MLLDVAGDPDQEIVAVVKREFPNGKGVALVQHPLDRRVDVPAGALDVQVADAPQLRKCLSGAGFHVDPLGKRYLHASNGIAHWTDRRVRLSVGKNELAFQCHHPAEERSDPISGAACLVLLVAGEAAAAMEIVAAVTLVDL